MTNINFRDNKTKTIGLMGIAILGFVMLSPTTVIPNVNAQFESRNLPVDWQLEQTILGQLKSHRGDWIHMAQCDQNKCHTVYLGPKNKNPYSHGMPTLARSFDINGVDPYQAAVEQIQPVSYSDGTNGHISTPAELEQDFAAKSSNNANVDLLQNLDSWTGSNTHFIQSVLFYDEADLTGTGTAWYAEMDSWDNNGNDDFGTNIPDMTITTNSNTDNFAEYLFALGDTGSADDGCYETEVDDTSSGHSDTFSNCYSDDTSNVMKLTSKQPGGKEADSGSMTEELDTDDSSVYYWSTVQSDIQYTLGFYDHVLGTKYTTMNDGWTSYGGGSSGDLNAVHCTNGLSLTESTNHDTQKFVQASGC